MTYVRLVLQDMLDTNQYVHSELMALDAEQRQIDERAAHVEWQLRNVMDAKGTWLRHRCLSGTRRVAAAQRHGR